MRIVYHLGAHCTDAERLIRTLMRNQGLLAREGIVVPDPLRYRNLLRDTASTLKGRAASVEMQALVLEEIMDEDRANRLVLSWENFVSFPQWALKGRLYPLAAERVRAFTLIFPEIEAEFHLAIRNPATFLPELFTKQRDKTYEQFMQGTDPHLLRWSEMVEHIIDENPGVPVTVWCDEDAALIWPEILRAISGYRGRTALEGEDEILTQIMDAQGLARMRSYLQDNQMTSPAQRRRVVSAFLEKFAIPEKVALSFDLPGWTQSMVDQMTAAYHADIARIRALPGVTFIGG